MKAVILAGGIGKRLRPITESIPKALVEVNGKPILERIIGSLKENGITEFVVVVSYLKEEVIDYFGDGSRFGVSITYVTQPRQLGTADSLRYAGPEIREGKFLAVYGDLFFDSSIIRDALAESEKCDGLICVKNVDDPKRFGVLEMEGEKVKRIVEKSENPPSNLANAGIYVFPKEIFGAIEKTGLSPRGEYELTDSVNILIEHGMEFHAVRMPDVWIDVGNLESLEKARRHKYSQVFGIYDVRGIYPSMIDEEIVGKIGQALGTVAKGTVLVGRDGRHSSPSLEQSLNAGLAKSGCTVVELGLMPVHVMAVLSKLNNCYSAHITASHNPPEYNGVKMFNPQGKILTVDERAGLLELIVSEKLAAGNGSITPAGEEYKTQYLNYISGKFPEKFKLKCVADYGNGTGSIWLSELFRKLGIELVGMNEGIDGAFPGRGPDAKKSTTGGLSERVRRERADFGIAFDGDGDRVVFLDENGDYIDGNKIYYLFAREYSKNSRFSVAPVFASAELEGLMAAHGGSIGWSATGCVNVIRRMEETHAAFGGEPSGHWIDYSVVPYFETFYFTSLFARIVNGKKASELVAGLKDPALFTDSVECPFEKKPAVMQEIIAKYAGRNPLTIDGVRFFDGSACILLRQSNTEPIIRISVESRENGKELLEKYTKEIAEIVNS